VQYATEQTPWTKIGVLSALVKMTDMMTMAARCHTYLQLSTVWLTAMLIRLVKWLACTMIGP